MTVLAFQPRIAKYREKLWPEVKNVLDQKGIDFRLYVSRNGDPRQTGDAIDSQVAEVGPKFRTFRGLRVHLTGLRELARSLGSNHVFAEFALRNLDVFLLSLLPRGTRPSIALMGHSPQFIEGNRVVQLLRNLFLRRADWFFAYTPQECDRLELCGFPAERITVVNNTVDTDGLRESLDRVTEEDLCHFVNSRSLTPGKTGLFLGTIDGHKDIDYVLATARHLWLADPEFRVLIAGSGRDLSRVEQISDARPEIEILGRVVDSRKALALRAADIILCPRGIGLVAVDSLVAGVPIASLLGNKHGPEVDFLDRTTSFFAPSHTSPEGFAQFVLEAVSNPQRLDQMRLAGKTRADSLSIQTMSHSVANGISDWVNK